MVDVALKRGRSVSETKGHHQVLEVSKSLLTVGNFEMAREGRAFYSPFLSSQGRGTRDESSALPRCVSEQAHQPKVSTLAKIQG